jgi:hypothetical protein
MTSDWPIGRRRRQEQKEVYMAYLFIDVDGDAAVKFERGEWDSLMGYLCPKCNSYIGDPLKAMKHENELPCLIEPEKWEKIFYFG